MSFSELDKTKILRLKSSIASYYNLTMKKIGDRHLESLFYNHCIISGGMISSLFHDEAVNDIDVYCKDKTSMTSIKDYIINSGKNIKSIESYHYDSNGNKVTEEETFKLITQNAVTLTNDVQFIYMDTWDNCKKKFDLVHCLPHYDIGTQKFYISESQFKAIQNKQLIPTEYVALVDKRRDKYVKRGWKHSDAAVNFFKWNDTNNVPGIIAQEISQLIPTVI